MGAAGSFLFQSEKQITTLTSAVRAFDVHAREATAALSDLRVAQQAYVAEGQGLPFWTAKVATTSDMVGTSLKVLRQSAAAGGARTALDEASATLAEFNSIDQRVHDYIKSGQQLMAADVIFTEGVEAAATAGRQVETARLAEHQAFDINEAGVRKQEVQAVGATAAVAALVTLLLVPVPRARGDEPVVAGGSLSIAPSAAAAADTPSPPVAAAPAASPAPVAPSAGAPGLKMAAGLATDFGRVRDLDELTRLLERASEAMGASGLIVWMGSAAGADLRPVLAHGYSAQTIARMPPVARAADNAAAAAYRSGTLQIVLSRPGGSTGAIVAPILAADGCIGALSAEIRGGGEASEGVQALATIIAAHLANVLASTPGTESQNTHAATS